MKNVLIGAIAAIFCAGIIIFAVEYERSLLQVFIGFAIFVLPITFIGSFKSKVGSFLFIFSTIIIGYTVSKFLYHDFWIGVLLAGIIGGSASYFRVEKYQPFSATDYEEMAKNKSKLNKE
tara:strand:- start:204 stop:563 length:360 start_codon:yes stop_codon:yes gene_type:complete